MALRDLIVMILKRQAERLNRKLPISSYQHSVSYDNALCQRDEAVSTINFYLYIY